MRGRRGLLWVLAATALALLAGRGLAALYGEWAFHHALGTDAVWRTGLFTAVALRLGIFAVAFAFLLTNCLAVRGSIVSLVLPRTLANLEIPEEIPPKWLTGLALVVAAVVAAAFAVVDQNWTVARLAFAGARFGEFEPYLERDLGFYVTWLPFEQAWRALGAVLLVVTTLLVTGLYVATPSVRWDQRGLYVSTWVRRHLGILGGLAILMLAWGWRLDRFELLVQGGGTTSLVDSIPGFSAFEHRVLIPYLVMLAFLAIPVALLFAWGVWRGNLRLAFALATALLVGGPVTRIVLRAVAGGGTTGAGAVARARPYQSTSALFTRRAFAVDAIARPETLQLVRLDDRMVARQVSSWDPAALSRHLELSRRGTDVVTFAWRGSDAGLEAVLLRANAPDAPPGSRWSLDRILASASDAGGGPASVPGGFGQGIGGILVEPGAGPYALVADSTGRLAAPHFETTLQRIAHAWSQQDPRLLAADAPTLRPRLMVHRDVRERIARVAPFLEAGPMLTPLLRGDSLYWVVELFAMATEYPLSQRLVFASRPARYLRHAATALVQAQTGHIALYPVAAPDPVTRSWIRIFPSLFTDRNGAPSWLAVALPPVVDLAVVQGTILGRTGFFGDSVIIRGLARIDDADADLAPGPPSLFQVEPSGTLGWSIPVIDAADEITGLLVATGGLHPRTEFHPTTAGPRWTSVLEDLQAAADSAGAGRALTHARRGRVQAIPLASGAAFSQGFYEWPPDGPPRLVAVAVLDGGRTRIGRNLADALGLREPSGSRGSATDPFRARVAALYDQMGVALRAGDWRAYGDAWAALGRLLGRSVPTP